MVARKVAKAFVLCLAITPGVMVHAAGSCTAAVSTGPNVQPGDGLNNSVFTIYFKVQNACFHAIGAAQTPVPAQITSGAKMSVQISCATGSCDKWLSGNKVKILSYTPKTDIVETSWSSNKDDSRYPKTCCIHEEFEGADGQMHQGSECNVVQDESCGVITFDSALSLAAMGDDSDPIIGEASAQLVTWPTVLSDLRQLAKDDQIYVKAHLGTGDVLINSAITGGTCDADVVGGGQGMSHTRVKEQGTCDQITPACGGATPLNKGSNTTCTGDITTCDSNTCCEAEATCDAMTTACGGATPVNKGSGTKCPGNAASCTTALCCEAEATCDLMTTACEGATPVNKGSGTKCTGNAASCTTTLCCEAQGTCNLMTTACSDPTSVNKGPGKKCPGNVASCTTDLCCEESATCDLMTTPCSGAAPVNKGAGTKCPGNAASCTTEMCCEAEATCDMMTPACNGTTPVNKGPGTKCTGDVASCNSATCCEANKGCDSCHELNPSNVSFIAKAGVNCYPFHGAMAMDENVDPVPDSSATSLEECKQACSENPKCEAFVLGPSGCFLRTSYVEGRCVQDKSYSTYVKTGLTCTWSSQLAEKWDSFYGYNCYNGKGGVPVADKTMYPVQKHLYVQDCACMCEEADDCSAFAFHEPEFWNGVMNPDCYLLSSANMAQCEDGTPYDMYVRKGQNVQDKFSKEVVQGISIFKHATILNLVIISFVVGAAITGISQLLWRQSVNRRTVYRTVDDQQADVLLDSETETGRVGSGSVAHGYSIVPGLE